MSHARNFEPCSGLPQSQHETHKEIFSSFCSSRYCHQWKCGPTPTGLNFPPIFARLINLHVAYHFHQWQVWNLEFFSFFTGAHQLISCHQHSHTAMALSPPFHFHTSWWKLVQWLFFLCGCGAITITTTISSTCSGPKVPTRKNEFCKKPLDFFQFSKITRRLLERQLEDIISRREVY